MKTKHFILQSVLRAFLISAVVLSSMALGQVVMAGGGGSTGGSGGSGTRTVSTGTHAVTTSRSLANTTARNLNTGTGGYRVPNGTRATVVTGSNGTVRVDVRAIERSDGNNRTGLPVRSTPGTPGGVRPVGGTPSTPVGGGPGSTGSCVANQGQSCQSTGRNMCNQTGSGQISCSGACTATVPSDTVCTSINDLDNGMLQTNPAVVRVNDPVTVTWDLGPSQNHHSNCTLRGPGITGGSMTLTGRVGEVRILSVTGPHQYTLSCGTVSVTRTLLVLPEVYES